MEIKRVCALYFSATGNTEKTVAAFAETLAEQLGVPWERLPFTKPAERERDYMFADTDLVVVGTPTYAGKLPNKILPDLRISATRFAYEVFAHLAISHPIPQKKARGCSATGFTQKRHTLYAYYSRGKSEFQMLFFTDFGSGTRLRVCECCLRHLHVFSPFSPPVPLDGRCVLLPPVRRSRARLPPALSPCPTPA